MAPEVKPRGELKIMDPQAGDLKSTWDPDDADEVAAVKATFDKMRRQGMAAYRVGRDGKKREVMHTFDPEAGAIIMAPPIAGG